jgi:hypothetical protein
MRLRDAETLQRPLKPSMGLEPHSGKNLADLKTLHGAVAIRQASHR